MAADASVGGGKRENVERLRAFLQNLPPDSATQAAIDYGVDVSRLARDLLLTPTERVRRVQSAVNFVLRMQHGRAERS
jgi:hypothetical protein